MATPSPPAARILLLAIPLCASFVVSAPVTCENDAHLSLLQAKAKLVNVRHARGASLLQIAQEELLNSADLQGRIGALTQESESALGAAAQHSHAALRVQALVSFGDAASNEDELLDAAVLPFPSQLPWAGAAASASPPANLLESPKTLPPLVFAQTADDQPLPPFDNLGLPAEDTAAKSKAEAEAFHESQWQKMQEEAEIDSNIVLMQPAARIEGTQQQDRAIPTDASSAEPKSLADMIKERTQQQGLESIPQPSSSTNLVEEQSQPKQQRQSKSDMLGSTLAFPDLQLTSPSPERAEEADRHIESAPVTDQSGPVDSPLAKASDGGAVLQFPAVWSDPASAAPSVADTGDAGAQPRSQAWPQLQAQQQAEQQEKQPEMQTQEVPLPALPQAQTQAQAVQLPAQTQAQAQAQAETQAKPQSQPRARREPRAQPQPSTVRELPWQQKLQHLKTQDKQTQADVGREEEEASGNEAGNSKGDALPTLQEALAKEAIDDAYGSQASSAAADGAGAEAAGRAPGKTQGLEVAQPSAQILESSVGKFGDGKLRPATAKVKHSEETDAIIDRFVHGMKPQRDDSVEPPQGDPVIEQLTAPHMDQASAHRDEDVQEGDHVAEQLTATRDDQASADPDQEDEASTKLDHADKPMPNRRPKAGRKSIPVEDMPHPAPVSASAGETSGLPALGFLKTHKTGSSTITSIVHRIGDAKNLNFFLPDGQKHANGLGWPNAFPGKDAAEFNGMPKHQYDVVCNHAVYNDERMRSYLRPNPFFFTVLRHPMTQVQSAFDYYNPPCGSDWSERIAWLKKVEEDSNDEAEMSRGQSLRAQFQNPQAHDLGWYEYEGGAAVFDSNDEEVDKWINEINQTISLVMLTEYLDEGLVLMAKKLNLKIDDVKYYYMKSGGVHKSPTAEQASELRKMLHVDIHLYDHFSEKFWEEWDQAGGYGHLNEDLEELRGLNENLQKTCGADDKGECPWNYRTDSVQFTEYLKEKQAALAHTVKQQPSL